MVSSTALPHGVPPHDAPRLDGLRAIAATLVVLTHSGFLSGQYYNGQVGAFLARSDVGVPIFFALSGFLLSRGWARRSPGGPGCEGTSDTGSGVSLRRTGWPWSRFF